MRGGSQSKDGPTTIQVIGKVFHRGIIGSNKPKEQEHHVGLIQNLHAGNIRGARRDVAIIIKTKEDGTLETISLGQNACDGRAGFLTAILVIAGNKHNVLPFARTFGSLVNQGSRFRGNRFEFGQFQIAIVNGHVAVTMQLDSQRAFGNG